MLAEQEARYSCRSSLSKVQPIGMTLFSKACAEYDFVLEVD